MVVFNVGTLDADVTDEDRKLLLVIEDGGGEGEAVVMLDGSPDALVLDDVADGMGIATGAVARLLGGKDEVGGGLGTPRGVTSPLAEGESTVVAVEDALRSSFARSTAVHQLLTSSSLLASM